MAAGREFVIQFIEMYRELPCLRKTTDSDYHNKLKKDFALDQLLDLFKEQDQKATRDYVNKKITSMRGSFRKELNKVRASERSGTSRDEVHVPKLWYYDLLMFLEDQKVPRQSKSASSILDELPFCEDEVDESEPNTSATLSRESTRGPSRESSKRPRAKADKLLEKIAGKIDEPVLSPTVQMPPKQRHDIFGEYIADELRSINPGQLTICQKLINDAIFYAELGALTLSSKMCTDEREDSQLRAGNQDRLLTAYMDAMHSLN